MAVFGKTKKKKKKDNYFLPHELQHLSIFFPLLPIMTLVHIKLLSYDTFSHSVSQMS
jgi:hypothetical protein